MSSRAIARTSSHTSIAQVAIAAIAGAALISCGHATVQGEVKGASNRGSAANGWVVGCESYCDVQARAKDLSALCDVVATKSGAGANCSARAPLGLSLAEGTIGDLAVLDVTSASSSQRTALLAMQTELGWVLARELGRVDDAKGEFVGIVAAHPADVAGLDAAAYEVRAVVGGATSSEERLFVCGLRGDGAVDCPLAARVAMSARDTASPLSASIANVLFPTKSEGWRVDVALTSEGFVASSPQGALPNDVASIVGEHAWGDVAR